MTTLHLHGSCSTFPSVSSSWSRESKVKNTLPTFHPVGRKDRLISLKCSSRSSVGAALVLKPKFKLFRISAFRGSNQHDNSGGRANGSKSINDTIKITFLQDESEQSSMKSSKVQDIPAHCSTVDETASRSLAIRGLFKNWLMILHSSGQTELVDDSTKEPSSTESSEVPHTVQEQGKDGFVKAIAGFFLHLDATITIPLMIFVPLCLAINVVYGFQVTKELAPFWILGPLIASFYVKMIRGICRLYVFTFMKTVSVIKNLPAYCILVYKYIYNGKLKEAISRPFLDMKNMSLKEATRKKLNAFQEWLLDRYLDFIESIWPIYCRTIRFLKRANLI